MKKIITSALALTAGVLMLAGCAPSGGTHSLDTSNLSSFETVEDLAAAYVEAGGECVSATEAKTIPGNKSLLCEDGTQLLIMSPENVAELRNAANSGTSLQGIQIVNGQNWGLIPLDTSKAADLAKTLGGEVIKEK